MFLWGDDLDESSNFAHRYHFVNTSGLRWIGLMLLMPIPWAQRIWALPFMTVLAPSERYYQQRRRMPKTVLQRSAQMLKVLCRWLPKHTLVVVGDSAYSALDFLSAMQQLHLTFVTRLRLDAALFEPAPPYSGKGRPRKKGKRLPTLAQVLQDANTVWTTLSLSWYDGQVREIQITSACAIWFHFGKLPLPIRWVLVRDPHGDYEPIALLSTDPAAHPSTAPRHAIWYPKSLPTFSDALALVRQHLWTGYPTFQISQETPDMLNIPKPFFDMLISTLCYAA